MLLSIERKPCVSVFYAGSLRRCGNRAFLPSRQELLNRFGHGGHQLRGPISVAVQLGSLLLAKITLMGKLTDAELRGVDQPAEPEGHSVADLVQFGLPLRVPWRGASVQPGFSLNHVVPVELEKIGVGADSHRRSARALV